MATVLRFVPSFHARIWGGRRLQDDLGRALPAEEAIGESWELVDREEHQSVVADGPLAGSTLGALWSGPDRERLFGARAARAGTTRFPLLVKLLDATHTLSVQVHPPAERAEELEGEPKTEMWVLVGAEPGAHLFAGLRAGVDRERFEAALRAGDDVSGLLHRHDVREGDAMFIPSGRVHAIGAGCLILEVQQNSDTTYRVFDFNRAGLDGQLRELHIEPSLASIDFADPEPGLIEPRGDVLVDDPELPVERWVLGLDGTRTAAPEGECAVLCGLGGGTTVAGEPLGRGDCLLVAADAPAEVRGGSVLRVLLPG